jgi:Cof subfamily protein (haloacid dehalogenase superfamily)
LDGTLLKAPGEKPGERLLRLQRSKYLADAKITVATGRTYAGARPVLDAFGEPGQVPVVLYNGSVVLQPENKRLIAHRIISESIVNRIIKVGFKESADIFVYQFLDLSAVPNSARMEWSDFERVSHFGSNKPPAFEFNKMPIVKGELPILTSATAVLLLPTALTNYAELIKELDIISGISVTSSGSKYIEIRPFGSSKAVGMDDLAHSMGLSSDEVLAVGDNDNDVELLRWAGISVAVMGASLSAINACDYITRFGAERGAIEVLDLIRRAKRLNPGKNKNERKR